MKRPEFPYIIGILWACAFIAIRMTYGLIETEEADYTLHNLLVSGLRTASDALWLVFPLVLLSCCKRKNAARCAGILWTAGWCATAWITIWYARHFGTPIHYTDLTLTQNLDGLGKSILATIHGKDFLTALPVLFGMTLWLHATGHIPAFRSLSRRTRRKAALCLALLWAGNSALFVLTAVRHPYVESGTDRNIMLKHYGIFHLIRYDMLGQRRPTADETEWAKAFYRKHRENHSRTAPSFMPDRKRNLILILVESLPSWVIGKTINDVEITPCLNRIVRNDSVLYWPNVIPQTRNGRSSDAQLIINTGLLPTQTGTVANLYARRPFPSLPKALAEQGYNFICDHASFWNQKATSLAYGFTRLYDKTVLAQSDKNLPDSVMFALALKELQTLPEPFYAQLVTLSSHCPYETDNCPDLSSPFLRMLPHHREAACFLAAIHYTDRCIGQFVETLHDNGLASRSVIAITGDHEDYTLNRLEGRPEAMPEDYCVPFVLMNSGLKAESTEATVAQSDIYPSLLYLTGCSGYGFVGFGENLFGPTTGAALTRKNEVAGKSIPTHKVKELHNRQAASDILIRGNAFKGL